MAKIVTPHVPGVGPTSGIQDAATRQALRPIMDAHNVRNGTGEQGFVTRDELKKAVEVLKSELATVKITPEALDAMGVPLKQGAKTYTVADLKRDLANGIESILASAGPDFRLWVDNTGAKIEIGHKDLVYAGYSAVADTTNTRLPGLAITAGGIAMGYNDIDGQWVDAVAIEAATGNASFAGTVNALYGNFAEGITIGTTGVTLGQLAAGSYTTDQLKSDLAAGVEGVLAGLGTNYRMALDANGAFFKHKDAVYGGTATPANGLTAVAVTASGVAMGYNHPTTGAWINAVAISATGDVTVAGTIKASSVIEANATVSGYGTIGGIAADADQAASDAAAALLAASSASSQAANANNAVSDMSADDKLSPVEKKAIRTEWDSIIASEKSSLNSQATTFGITTENTAYNNAWQALATYLNNGTAWVSGIPSWINDANLGSTTAIVGSAFRGTVKDFYDARTALLNAIALKAKTLADAAQGTANTANSTANSANSTAGTALSTANSANSTANSALSQVSSKLSASSSYILTGAVTVQDTGGIKAGSIAWNSTTGEVTGGSGVVLTEYGLIGAKGGVPTFTITSAGDATFKGDVKTSGDVYGSGSVSGSVPIYLAGASRAIDYSVCGYAESNASNTSIIRAGVLGYASAVTSSYNIGVVGIGSRIAKGIGVAGDGVQYGGYFYSPNVALFVEGKMAITNSTLVSNLNADLLDGYHASSFPSQFQTQSGTGNISSGSVYFYTSTGLTAYQFFSDGGGSVGMRSVSDARLKQDVVPETLGLDFIKQLSPVQYRMKADPSVRHHGFVAQDMEPLIEGVDSLKYQYADGVKGMDYLALIAPLVKAVQELTAKVEALEAVQNG